MGTKRLILIVEDDADLRRMFRNALILEGFDVEEAADGLDALRKVEQRTPALIILDLGLPMFDGVAVKSELAAQMLTQDIPVVIVTGRSGPLDELRAACVLRKPIGPDKLVQTVRECLTKGAPPVF